MIKQLPIPLFVYILRVLWRNFLILLHNSLILPIIFLYIHKSIGPEALIAILGLILIIFFLGWISLLLAILCARYRDLPQIIASLLQVAFYITPIIWMPSLLQNRLSLNFLQINPFYHVLEVVRAPLLGSMPSFTNWFVVLTMTILGWILTLAFFLRFRHRVVYWL